MRERGPLALRQVLRFVPRTSRALVEIISIKRPEAIVRRSRYSGVVVDERVLTEIFPWVPRSPTLQAYVLLAGTLQLAALDGSSTLRMRPGDTALLSPSDASHARYQDVSYLDVEWTPAGPPAGPAVRGLAPVDLARAQALGERLATGATPDAEIFTDAFALFREAGAPLGDLSVDAFEGGPSAQDLRIGQAITAQIADLRMAASALSLGEHAELSPRQVQRIFAQFCERYRLNATSWRDMRNRYRLQIAILLASIPSISVATLADEVGYASPAALARAFANAGLPSPSELRDAIVRMHSVP
jgi:AraC-like DNA-binding protein